MLDLQNSAAVVRFRVNSVLSIQRALAVSVFLPYSVSLSQVSHYYTAAFFLINRPRHYNTSPQTMSNPNTIVIFGPSPNSYYVGHGRLHFVENMSPSFTNHAKTALSISFSQWISVSKTANTWIDYNIATDKCSKDNSDYFVKGKHKGGWTAVLPDYFIQQLSKIQREVLNFDAGITGMLFGKGKTNICLFETGFQANFDEEEITFIWKNSLVPRNI
ncbi:hypothetical protein BT96DRAFT_947076 [Gymnopus androsaceus JB14]|uniref:Uncharacterized protein n=1 Tax=Gymnopus androsaceus JB14 TaxID=1447944 RepID=A0A6A4GUP5_9AGAR|nr:hypothetical protein BT96DRAFT_947076 [Gymnopus androsaceus JB14]